MPSTNLADTPWRSNPDLFTKEIVSDHYKAMAETVAEAIRKQSAEHDEALNALQDAHGAKLVELEHAYQAKLVEQEQVYHVKLRQLLDEVATLTDDASLSKETMEAHFRDLEEQLKDAKLKLHRHRIEQERKSKLPGEQLEPDPLLRR